MRVSLDELVTGCEAFEKRERRDAMYRVTTGLIQQSWRDGGKVADALGVLLLTWNQAFYRYGVLDFNDLGATTFRAKPLVASWSIKNMRGSRVAPKKRKNQADTFGSSIDP